MGVGGPGRKKGIGRKAIKGISATWKMLRRSSASTRIKNSIKDRHARHDGWGPQETQKRYFTQVLGGGREVRRKPGVINCSGKAGALIRDKTKQRVTEEEGRPTWQSPI